MDGRAADMRRVVNALFYRTREGRLPLLPVVRRRRRLAENPRRPAGTGPGPGRPGADARRRRRRQPVGQDGRGRTGAGKGGGKKVHGRKRHTPVDTPGLPIAVAATAANVGDGRAAPEASAQAPGRDFPRPRAASADDKYHSQALYAWLRLHRRPYRPVAASRPEGVKEFKPPNVRRVVERTFAWPGRYRRPSKDHEHTAGSSETAVRPAATHHMPRRPRPGRRARSQRFRFKPRPRKQAA